MNCDADVLIIGAGPSGAMAAAYLRRQGRRVLIFEREQFPRFSIGESLLPQSMGLLEAAGLLRPVVEAGFQFKNGASFVWGKRSTFFDFRDKFGEGWGTTYQVQRATFDHLLAGAAEGMGAEVRYRHEILEVDVSGPCAWLKVKGADGSTYEATGRFLLDASGFGRVLPRLLGLERPSGFPARRAIFSHLEDRIAKRHDFDRNKIRIGVHPEHVDIWYWLIPFSNGRASIGVVASQEQLAPYTAHLDEGLKAIHFEDPGLKDLLADALWDTPARQIGGYAADVTSLTGPHFALLGNAGEFLDPVFSSGVTIAFKSASLAAPLIGRELDGGEADWDAEYSKPLRQGVDCFRGLVESWYAGRLQNVIFHDHPDPGIRRKLCAILAGYAWDVSNPLVAEPRRMRSLEAICASR